MYLHLHTEEVKCLSGSFTVLSNIMKTWMKRQVPISSLLERNLQSQIGRKVLHLSTIHRSVLWLWKDSFKYQELATTFYDQCRLPG
ncbi:hypothetical protein GDO81_005204 [Engystomops pustulosus]|uniref:Uncharacterized protein n=1 Tax=Engystomops pustulosus TaxID=76066 RepID=A0AAV7CLT0_ENGPU|nr:hypothetical protein GDO81_005204 [Engystomops pustulosus]